ncbi:MAG: metal-dependent hydrolase [Rhodothermales bacterium]|nr:metal-dependent hydrolase [Rhodothermales bacterium]MBO6779446.1 metal-dependent hydrolase [Rhodothermales bacterium]
MDSLTQIALGAAVGEAAVGREAGGRGAAWGAALGTLPDLDILAYPFLDSVGELAFHRGLTHSLVFAVVMAPLVGTFLARLHRAFEVPRWRWRWMVFWVIGTHILLDSFTVYGTQVFWPVTDYPLAFNSLFIIDPLYTIPLAMGVVFALFLRRGSSRRAHANQLGLLVSTLYVLWSLVAKGVAYDALNRGWAAAGLEPERTMTNATPLNTIMWMGIAQQDDSLHVGLFSLLDSAPPDSFLVIPMRSELVRPVAEERAVRRVLGFSKGWYSAFERDGALVIDDYRFGRSDGWLGDSGSPIFRFVMEPGDCGDTWCSFYQARPMLGSLGAVWDRMWGQ